MACVVGSPAHHCGAGPKQGQQGEADSSTPGSWGQAPGFSLQALTVSWTGVGRWQRVESQVSGGEQTPTGTPQTVHGESVNHTWEGRFRLCPFYLN